MQSGLRLGSVGRPAAKIQRWAATPNGLASALQRAVRDQTLVPERAAEVIAQFNAARLKAGERRRLTDQLLQSLAPALQAVYRRYLLLGRSLPEDAERRAALRGAVAAIAELGRSYRILCRQYAGAGWWRRSRLTASTVGLLECAAWEQRLRWLRYQPLPASVWRACNHAFISLIGHVDLQRPWPAQCPPQKTQGVTRRSLHDWYVSLQLAGWLDVANWPSHALAALDDYLPALTALVDLRPSTRRVQGEGLWISADQAGPARVGPRPAGRCKLVHLGIDRLRAHLAADYRRVAAQQFAAAGAIQDAGATGFHNLNRDERLAVLEHMQSRCGSAKRSARRTPAYASKAVRMYLGFADAYRAVRDHWILRSGAVQTECALRDAMAEFATLVVTDESQAQERRWQVLNEGPGGLLVRTREMPHSRAVDVGEVVAHNNCGRKGNARAPAHALELGFVSRIRRVTEDELELAIVRLAHTAWHAGIRDPLSNAAIAGQAATEGAWLAALISLDLEDRWQLIVQAREAWVPGTPLKLHWGDTVLPVRIGEIRATGKGFVAFAVRSPRLPVEGLSPGLLALDDKQTDDTGKCG